MLPLLVSALLANAAFDSAMAKAKNLYSEAEWDAALRELTIAERNASGDTERLQVLLYQGVVLANVPDLDAAQASWERALLIDGEARLPLAVTPKIQAHFDRVKRTVRATREAVLKSQAPPPDAPVKARIEPAATPSSEQLTSEAPSGVPVVPIAIAGGAVVAAGVGIGLGLMSQGTVAQARANEWSDEKAQLHGAAQTQALAANVMYSVAGAAAVTALITFLVTR